MGMGSAPTWLRQVSPPPPPSLHKTALTTARNVGFLKLKGHRTLTVAECSYTLLWKLMLIVVDGHLALRRNQLLIWTESTST